MTPNEAEEMLTRLADRHLPKHFTFSWFRDHHTASHGMRVYAPKSFGQRLISDTEAFAIRNAPAAYRHNLVLVLRGLVDELRAQADLLSAAADRIARDEMAERLHQEAPLMPEAARHNAGKPELSQVFDMLPMLVALAEHMTAGRQKYPDLPDGRPNWTLGGKPDREYLDAATRHLAALARGEELDAETGTHHAAAVVWNMGALLTCNRQPAPSPQDIVDVVREGRGEYEDVAGVPAVSQGSASWKKGDIFYWVSGPSALFNPHEARRVEEVEETGVVYTIQSIPSFGRMYASFEVLDRHALLAGPPVNGRAPARVREVRELREYHARTGSVSA